MNKLNSSILLCLLLISSAGFAQVTPAASPSTEAVPNESAAPTAETPPATPAEETTATSLESAPAENTETTLNTDTETETRTQMPRGKRLPVQSISSWAVGLTSLQWNEPLTVSEPLGTAKSNLNFNGIGLVAQNETYYLRWGWNFGGVLAVGHANGQPYSGKEINRQAWSMLGITPRLFWRITNSVNVGGSAFVYYRTIDLDSEPGKELTAGRRTNVSILADMTLRIFKKWDFYQAIGPVGDGATMWKIGVNYRF